jgi:hypothetical protein
LAAPATWFASGTYGIMGVSLFLEGRMPEIDETDWPPHLDALVAASATHRLLIDDEAIGVLEVTVEPHSKPQRREIRSGAWD